MVRSLRYGEAAGTSNLTNVRLTRQKSGLFQWLAVPLWFPPGKDSVPASFLATVQRCNGPAAPSAQRRLLHLVRSALAQRRGASRAPGSVKTRRQDPSGSSDQVPDNLSTLKCGVRESRRPALRQVGYLRQFGEHILEASFTAHDPTRTSRTARDV